MRMDQPLRKFFKYLKPYKWQMIAGIFFILASLSFGLLVPYLVGAGDRRSVGGDNLEKMIYYPLVILGVNSEAGFFFFFSGGC